MAGRVSLFQEGDLQLGTFGSGRLTAWKFAQGVSYSSPRIRYRPIFGLQGAISSGDGSPSNPNLHTFYPLFPKGLYYGYMLFTSGSLNAIVVHPTASLQLSRILSLDIDNFFFLAAKHKRRAIFAIWDVFPHGADITGTLCWGDSGYEYRMAGGSTHHCAGLSGLLRSGIIPSGNSATRKKRKLLFCHS